MPTVRISSATRPLSISLQSHYTWTLWRWRLSSVYPIPLPSLLCASLDITARYPFLLFVIVNLAASLFNLGTITTLYNTITCFARKALRIGRVTGKVCFYYDIPPSFQSLIVICWVYMHGVQVVGTGIPSLCLLGWSTRFGSFYRHLYQEIGTSRSKLVYPLTLLLSINLSAIICKTPLTLSRFKVILWQTPLHACTHGV
jgi:hypothetical protein